MRKVDIETYGGLPSVNVKVYGRIADVTLPMDLGSSYPSGHPELVETSFTDDGFTVEWTRENLSDESLDTWFWDACASGMEDAQSVAEDIFGTGVTVSQDGRSGGHLVVDGLPDIESWDAIAVSRWDRFITQVDAIVEDIPRATLWLIYANVYEGWAEDQRKLMTGPTLEPVM